MKNAVILLLLGAVVIAQTPNTTQTTQTLTSMREISGNLNNRPCFLVLPVSGPPICATFGAGISLSGNVVNLVTGSTVIPKTFVVATAGLQTFTVTQAPLASQYLVWRNGNLLATPGDYSVVTAGGTSTVTLIAPTLQNDIIQIW